MKKAIIAPSKYIQGSDELLNLPQYCKPFGKGNVYIVISPSNLKMYGEALKKSFAKAGQQVVMDEFNRECCKEEIDRIIKAMKKHKMDIVAAVGGGKVIDTAKAVAYYSGLPVAVAPTIASTDAPCSALSVLYTRDGQFESYLLLPKNPDLVLVDVKAISKAPARLLVSGMGDALATYFEARAAAAANANVMSGGKSSQTALALARLCYDILLKDGLKAKLSAELQVVTPALEHVVEANTYLSGIGFESGGIAAAHAVHNGLTVLDETHHYYHGEKVAFGVLVQMILEDNKEDFEEVLAFCKSVGLPTCLAQLGIKKPTPKKILDVAKAACAEGESTHNMPFTVTAEDVYGAIMLADALGK